MCVFFLDSRRLYTTSPNPNPSLPPYFHLYIQNVTKYYIFRHTYDRPTQPYHVAMSLIIKLSPATPTSNTTATAETAIHRSP